MENSITGLKAQIESYKVESINQETGVFDENDFDEKRRKLLLDKAWEIKLLKDEIESYKLREIKLKEKRQKLETKMENDRSELENCLSVGEKISNTYSKISLTEKDSPVYEDESLISESSLLYSTQKIILNKRQILNDYKNGIEIPGFSMEKKSVLTIK